MPTGIYKRIKTPYWKGKHRDQETNIKISKAHKGKKYPNRKSPVPFSDSHRKK